MSEKLYERYELHRPFRLIFSRFEGADRAVYEFPAERDSDVLLWFNDYLRDGKKLPNLTPHGR
jgi:hypothetical protein